MGENLTRREWLVRLVIGGLLAGVGGGIGFFGKGFYEDWKLRRTAEIARLDSAVELAALLDESFSIYESQNHQAQRLLQMLQGNHGGEVPEGLGYDETFFRLFDRFTSEEAELQRLIRSTTMHSQRRLNESMSKWLQNAPAFKKGDQPNPQRVRFREQLRELELHLNQWHDKYEAVIPGDLKRTLVYLADEKGHGVGFPQGLKSAVDEVITKWQ
jgi:hypothetical protein